MRPGLHGGVIARELGVEHDIARFDHQPPALRHRIARVDREVHQDLLELAGIDPHAPQARLRHRDELDVLAEQTAEHAIDVEDQLIQVDDAGLDDLAPRECQELPREVRRALRGARDLGDVAERGIAGRGIGPRHLGVAEDRRQQVVEVVRDAASQPADAFHALREQELRFEAPQLGDVLADDQDAHALALGVAQARGIPEEGTPRAVRRRHVGFPLVHRLALEDAIEIGTHLVPLRLGHAGRQVVAPDRDAAGDAEKRFGGQVPLDDAPIGADDHDDAAGQFHQRPVAILARAQGQLGAHARRHVDGDAADERRAWEFRRETSAWTTSARCRPRPHPSG